MQEIIVYRNPMEAMFWGAMSNGSLFPFIVGVLVFLFVLLSTNAVCNKLWGRGFGRKAAMRTNLCLAIGVIAGLFTVWKMWV